MIASFAVVEPLRAGVAICLKSGVEIQGFPIYCQCCRVAIGINSLVLRCAHAVKPVSEEYSATGKACPIVEQRRFVLRSVVHVGSDDNGCVIYIGGSGRGQNESRVPRRAVRCTWWARLTFPFALESEELRVD